MGPEPKPIGTGDFDGARPITYLGPGDVRVLWDEIAISDEEFEAIYKEEKAFWAAGELRYRDTFGRSQRTTFKFYMTGRYTVEGNDRRMSVADDGNDAT